MRRTDESNKLEHHTALYNSEHLVIRRAQEFQIKLTFNRPYKPNEDKFAVEFTIGEMLGTKRCNVLVTVKTIFNLSVTFAHKSYIYFLSVVKIKQTNMHMFLVPPGSSPQFSKGTYIPVFFTKDRQSAWAGRIIASSDNVITVGITPGTNCIVGKYNLYVAVVTPYGVRRTRPDKSREMYILFNPWAKGLLGAQLCFRGFLPSVLTSGFSLTQMMLCSWMMRWRGRSV